VLRGLNSLYGQPLSGQELLAAARTLGADVPFFVTEYSAAWATGIGDVLEARPSIGALWVLLVNPGFPVSTRWVYENFTLTRESNPYILGAGRDRCPDDARPASLSADFVHNDLEAVTERRFPEITAIKEQLLAHGAKAALMSGSGPTVFGLFDRKPAAAASREQFAKRYGKGTILTKTRI